MKIEEKLSLHWNVYPEVELVVKDIADSNDIPNPDTIKKNQLFFLIEKGIEKVLYIL